MHIATSRLAQFGSGPIRRKARCSYMRSNMRDQVYRIYLDFLETAENKRHWSIFNDLPWDLLDVDKATDRVGQCIELFCAEELYVPDYSSKGMELSRSIFGTAWFQ